MRVASLVTLAALVGCSAPSDKDSWSQDTDPTVDTAGTGSDTADTGGDTADTGQDTATPVDVDGDGAIAGDDCDDTDAGVYPGAAETCDGIDQDCDGDVDEDATDARTWYGDADRDGYGDDAATTVSCVQPADTAERGGDCDDADAAFNPGASEVCTDPNDYNCDGSVGYADADADGVPACEDCDDASGTTFPGAEEMCNGVDDDCDAETDEAGATGEATWYADADGDGYGDAVTTALACESVAPSGYVADATDCDDTTGTTNPGALEVCGGADEDCDGTTDEDDASDAATWYADTDTDGYGDAAARSTACVQPTGTVANAADCDDGAASTNPTALEVCGGGDEDCDGTIDEDSASDAPTWFADTDGDGFGDADARWGACEAPEGYVADATDCDDTASATHPGADEVCGGDDEDCDGTTDEDDAVDALVWYADTDGDAWGDAATATLACEAPAEHVDIAGDCDDDDVAINPLGTEVCGGTDEDCDGFTDEDDASDAPFWYVDADTDGYGDPLYGMNACTQPDGHVADATDCDDTATATNPGALEVCGGTDEDCDGFTDEDDASDAPTWYADADGDGYGIASDSAIACESPFGYAPASAVDDCDESDTSINPGATEVCGDLTDNDCAASSDCDRTGVIAGSSAELVVSGANANDYLGNTVVAGDLNGDGADDLVAGASGLNNDSTSANYGRLYVWYGPVSGTATLASADTTITASVAAMNLGSNAIDVVPDMDGDGDHELIVGAHLQNSTATDAGYAYLIKGGTLPTATAGAYGSIYGTAAYDYVGYHLGSAGDVDGDGIGDFFVSATQRENGALTDAGQVVLYSGASYTGGTSTLPTAVSDGKALFSGPAANQNLGSGADGAGDMDGDGADEFIVGGPGSSSSTSTGGVAFLVYGTSGLFGGNYTQLGASGTTAVDTYWTGAANGDRLGLSVAGLGDTDGDGYDDVAVGADYSDPGISNAGRVYIIRGSATTATSGGVASLADAVLTGQSADDYFGRTVQGIGDMNLDGFMDLAVGATGRDLNAAGTGVTGAGSTYVFYGPLTSTTGASADFVVRGMITFDAVGSRIAPAADVDDDGYDDLLLGVAGYDPEAPVRSDAGGVFLFTGSGE